MATVTLESLPAEGLVRTTTIIEVLGICRSTWRRGVNNGKFPPPIRLTSGVVAWHVDDIREIAMQRKAKAETP